MCVSTLYVRPLGYFVRIRIQFHVCTVDQHIIYSQVRIASVYSYQREIPIHLHLRSRLKTVFTMECMNDDNDQITTINRLNRNNKLKLF